MRHWVQDSSMVPGVVRVTATVSPMVNTNPKPKLHPVNRIILFIIVCTYSQRTYIGVRRTLQTRADTPVQ